MPKFNYLFTIKIVKLYNYSKNWNNYKKLIFLFKPENFVLLTALFLNNSLKTSSVKSFQSDLLRCNRESCGEKEGSLFGLENLFQGQTS